METVKLPLASQVPGAAHTVALSKTSPILQEQRKVDSAKDFESLLVGKLVDSMKDTVGSSGLLEDEGSEQVQAMFWMHMSSAISQQGGVGMWKDIYKSIYGTSPAEERPSAGSNSKPLDKTI
jgi:Rod binding domain-containing protein